MSKKSCTMCYYIKGIDFFRLAISLNKSLENYAIQIGKKAQRTLSSMAVHSSMILSFCKDLNFIRINYEFTIHNAPHFAFLHFE